MAPEEEPRLGARMELGRLAFTAEAIVRFARLYDPQPFHVDAQAAARSPYGGLIASGWHTVSVWMAMFVRAHEPARRTPSGAVPDRPEIISPVGVGLGLADLRWREPVRAGDTIVFATVLEAARASASRPGWSVFRRQALALRPDDVCVMGFTLTHLAPTAAVLSARIATRSDRRDERSSPGEY